MEITLKWLTSRSKLDSLKCVACKERLDKLVTGINVLDNFESMRWVKSNELVLITAQFLNEAIEKQSEIVLIQNLAEINCAGIGIKVSKTMEEIPKRILDEAESCRLPVLEIPFYTTFSDITDAVFEMAFKVRTKRLQDEQKLIRKLFFGFGENHDLEKLLEPIGEFFEDMVLVINSANICLASTEVREGFRVVNPGDVVNIEFEKRQYGILDVRGKKFRSYIQALPNEKGYVLIRVGKKELNDNQKMVIQNISNMLSANLEKMDNSQKVDFQTNAGIIDFFLEEKEHMPEEIIQQCHFYHFPYALPRICMIVQIKSLSEDEKKAVQEYLKQIHLEQKSAEYLHNSSTYLCMNDTICGLFLFYDRSFSRPYVTKAAMVFADKIEEDIRALIGIQVRIGIGRCHRQLNNLPLGFQEAFNALRMKPYTTTDSKVGCYSYQLQYQLLSACSNEDLLFMWFDQGDTLNQYDKENNTELVQTLCTYVESRYNASQAAKQLFLHRNTLMRRLEKIEEILCISMDDFNAVMSVYLSICAYRILQ